MKTLFNLVKWSLALLAAKVAKRYWARQIRLAQKDLDRAEAEIAQLEVKQHQAQAMVPLEEREIVRPWMSVEDVLLPTLGMEGYPDTRIPLPWDFRQPVDINIICRDWRMVLNLYIGLEMPHDLSRMLENPFGDEPEYELVENVTTIVSAIAGVAGGIDSLHNALLIICGAGASATGMQIPNGKVMRCANLVYYMTTGYCVGDQEEIEDQLRALSGDITLQDAVKAVFDYFDLPHTPSAEYWGFEHKQVVL
jgi:hypothetical protein